MNEMKEERACMGKKRWTKYVEEIKSDMVCWFIYGDAIVIKEREMKKLMWSGIRTCVTGLRVKVD